MRNLIALFIAGCAFAWLAGKINTAYFSKESADAVPVEAAKSATEGRFRPEAPGPKAASLRKRDNHFWATAKVNGRSSITFMVDTGATSVALTRLDARKLGYKAEDLDFEYQVATAGGMTMGAYVLLDEIKIGNVSVEEVRALVLENESLEHSLLGMSFMSELSSYEVRKSSMILRE